MRRLLRSFLPQWSSAAQAQPPQNARLGGSSRIPTVMGSLEAIGERRHVEPELALRFMTRLGGALHRYGTPAHRLEEALTRAANALGLQGQFFSTPTELLFAFGGPEAQRTSLLRVEPGAVDLGRLAEVDDIASGVLSGTLPVAEAVAALDGLETEARHRGLPEPVVLLAHAMASGSASVLFGGGQAELLGALLLGALLGGHGLLARNSPAVARTEPVVAAVLVAAGAVWMGRWFGPMSSSNLIVSALIGHMPGLTLTVAMIELGTQNLASGTARLAAAVTRLLELGIGVALGARLGSWMAPEVALRAPVAVVLPALVEPLALLLGGLAFLVLLRVRLRDTGVVLAAGYVAVYGARFGEHSFGTEIGAAVGAFAVAAFANLYARAFDRPAMVPLVPGILMLVPGSMGFRSVSALIEEEVVSGLGIGFRALLVATSLATGVLVGQSVVPPRRAL